MPAAGIGHPSWSLLPTAMPLPWPRKTRISAATSSKPPKEKISPAPSEQADIFHADGQAAVFASRMTATPIPERSATTDFIHDAARVDAMHAMRFFLLGANEEAYVSA